MTEKILDRYKDELGDVVNYVEYYKMASDSTQKHIFKDIAKEEMQHATALKHLLEKAGGYNANDELKQMESDAKMALEEV